MKFGIPLEFALWPLLGIKGLRTVPMGMPKAQKLGFLVVKF